VFIQCSEAGLSNDSIAMADQVRVLAKSRMLRLRGSLTPETIKKLDQALLIALDLPRQND
ncbi:MAG: type II toxin-antitoxin system PemK/MazF family toxin, partial [Microcystaceae cyanobacterium]